MHAFNNPYDRPNPDIADQHLCKLLFPDHQECIVRSMDISDNTEITVVLSPSLN